MLNPSDINGIKTGDTVAFRKLFELLYPKLMAYACRYVDEQSARDIVQDLFASYWEKKQQIENDNILLYFYKWLHNSCLNYLKHRKVIEAYEEKVRLAEQRFASIESLLEGNDIFRQFISRDIRDMIELSVSKLPDRCADAFRLRYFEDMPHREIAERMNISQRTVEGHIRNAISFLRIELRDLLLLIFMFNNIF
ncbi:RNA polymerase sigma-70 factor [Dysgonomonas sp.]